MKKRTSSFLTLFYIVVFLYSGFSLVKYLYTYYETSQSLKEIQEIYETTLESIDESEVPLIQNYTIRPQFKDLQEVNQQIVGWISVDGTKVDNPILQADNNTFYLDHNFKDGHSRAGSIFMDYRNNVMHIGRNTILYGHAMKNGTMFGSLKNYLKQDYANAHRIFYLDTLYAGYDVEVFAAYETTIDFYYIETEFQMDEAFRSFIEEVNKRSVIKMDVEVGVDDQIVTLSTCKDFFASNEQRIVVQGRLVKR